jgi:hypothetical protein
VPHLRGRPASASLLYPSTLPADPRWDPARATLTVSLPGTPAACLVALTR